MRSHFERETTTLPIPAGRAFVHVIASAILAALVSVASPAGAAVSLSEMARLSAAERPDGEQILALFRGYVSLGLRREAAAFLERKVHLAQMTKEAAVPLFEQAVSEQSRWEDPVNLIEICETAVRNGASTPRILYSYGTALRQAGRYSDAAAVLSQIPKDSPFFPYALYALGQAAVEEGDRKSALEIFRRVRDAAAVVPDGGRLGDRAALSEAELLLSMGRGAEARPLLEGLRGKVDNPLVTVSLAAAGEDPDSEDAGPPEEAVAGWPARERILLFLLRGGLARDRGRLAEAIDHLTRAEEDLKAAAGSATPPATETFARYETTEHLARQIETHRLVRTILSTPAPEDDPNGVRDRVVELFTGLLFMDHTIARAQGRLPEIPWAAEVPFLTSAQIDLIFRKIEEVSLGGVEVDRMVEDLGKKVEVLQNLAHPIRRYRLMARLEKSQDEIRRIKERVRKSREAAIAGLETREQGGLSGLLTEMGKFLSELSEIRSSSGEVQEFTRRHFDILRRREDGAGLSPEDVREMVREALAFDNERFVSLLPAVKALEERARIVSWERKKQELLTLRPVISRQMVDVLVARARHLRGEADPEGARQAWDAVRRATGYLQGGRLSPRDRIESAVHVGSLFADGKGRWELFPGRVAGDREKEAIALLLPHLQAGADSGDRREESSYLLAVLKFMTGDPAGPDAARDFLRKFPSSPLAGGLAVRLGHAALMAGRLSEATVHYRKAADAPAAETGAVGRYMVGWALFQTGDARGATRELSVPLSDPSFACGEPSPFEQEVVKLAVRAWREVPVDALGPYSPVAEGGCGGKHLLASLGEDEKKRGESGRAAAVYDLLARRFMSDEAALSYEKKAVEELLRAGKEDQAFARALKLGERYGPGSEWEKTQPQAAREKAREELAAMLKSLSERKFEEGIRSGERAAMTSAKEGMERFFAVRDEKQAGGDPELRLKWAIASLKAGDRELGVGILKGLTETGEDAVGEKAGVLYAETMIAGYERKEEKAEDAESAALLLMGRFPSEKAVSLAHRAAAAFMGAGQYGRAARLAESIEGSKAASAKSVAEARLIRAEALVFLDDHAGARGVADSVLAGEAAGVDPKGRERARDLFLLGSLKEIEAKTASEDWIGAARNLEELSERFPKAPDAPSYILRAMRSYRLAGDMEGALRTGTAFLERYPRREEAVEIAGTLGPYFVERKEFARAADLYARVSERFPKSDQAPAMLFHAARISKENGDPEGAGKRYAAYRARYSNPRWMSVHATLSLGFLAADKGDTRTAIREMEEGLRLLEAGVEKDAPREFFGLAGRARISIGEYWADQFRKIRLVVPLEKSLALKDRFFRRALASYDKARAEAPLEEALDASQRSGDLYVEFGSSILESQRPKGLAGEEREGYERALKDRARTFFERAQEWYAAALDRLEAEQGPSDLAAPIRQRIEEAQRHLAGLAGTQEGQ